MSRTVQDLMLALSASGTLCVRHFFYIRVFNPLASSNWEKDVEKMYVKHEKEKRTEFNERILQIEKGTFTPLVFSCAGGAGTESTKLIKHLAKLIADKKQEPYSQVVNSIRRRSRFDIVRCGNLSLRGFRGQNNFDSLEDMEYELCPDQNKF